MSIARPPKSDRGFTLVELLVVAVIVMVLAIGISRLFTRQIATFAVQDETSRMQQQARVAQDMMVRTIQQAGGMTKVGTASQRVQGGAILSASDHHITVQYDDPAYDGDIGSITPREVVTFVVGNDAATCSNVETLPEFEVFMPSVSSNYVTINNLTVPICKPPYKLYRMALSTSNYNSGVKEILAENVDNMVFRYYDASRSQIMADAAATPPVWYGNLPSGETVLSTIRTVDVELTLRAEKPDREYTGTYTAQAGTVGGYTSGAPSANPVTVTDGYRRRTYKSLITPGNMAPNECGEIKLTTVQANPLCPAPTTIRAMAKDKFGVPYAGRVTFYIASGPADPTLGITEPGTATPLYTTYETTTGADGIKDVELHYMGTSTSIVVGASSMTDCGPTDSITINFLPGLSSDIRLSTNDFSGLLLETCSSNMTSFTATSYDQCGNIVPPQAGYSLGVYDQAAPAAGAFLGELNGTGGPVTLTSSPQTFTVKAPTSLTPAASAARDANGTIFQYVREATRPSLGAPSLWVRNVTTPDGTIVTSNLYTINSIPWPPSNFTTISDGINGVTVSDCAGPQTLTATFGINDCNNIPIWNLLIGSNAGTYRTKANQNKTLSQKPAGSPALSDAQMGTISGIVAGAPYLETGNTTIDYSAASGGVYTLNWAKPECQFGPPAFPVGSQVKPYMAFQVAGVTTSPHVMMPVIEPCRTCSVQATPNVVSTCDGKALITVTKCQQSQEPVILTVKDSAGVLVSNAKWMDYDPATGVVTTQYGPYYDQGLLTDPGNTGNVTLEKWLDVSDIATGTPLTITATSNPAGIWSCSTDITLGNTCQSLKTYYTTLDVKGLEGPKVEITYGTQSLCAAVVNRLYFELTRCSYSPLNPQTVKVAIVDQVNGYVDEEIVQLDDVTPDDPVYPKTLFQNGTSLPVFIVPNTLYTTASGNGTLEMPPTGTVQLILYRWENKTHTPVTEYCPPTDQTIDFVRPVPICFPNAITSGGGASWNGNVKVHWGDVVVRGHIDGINAAKQIFKGNPATTGGIQFDGSSYAGWLSDPYVDFYVGKATPLGMVEPPGDGQYQDAIPGWLPNTAYTLGKQIIPAGSQLAFEVITAGTSGAAAPAWPTDFGIPVNDGTVKWEACVYQPYKSTKYGNYFGNLSNEKINEMIVTLEYGTMRTIALTYSSGSYWFTVPTADVGKLVTLPNGQAVKLKTLYNDKTFQTADLIDVLNVSPVTGKNVYYNGDFIFIDTYGNSVAGGPPTRPNLTGAAIDAAAAVTIGPGGKFTNLLPKHSISGDFFSKGIIYAAGNMDFSGIGNKTLRNDRLTPPRYENTTSNYFGYDINTHVYSEDDLPLRPVPDGVTTQFNLNVHIDGAVYVDGYFGGTGNPFFYGAITAEKGYESGGEPEVWYNYALNVSGVKGALCVQCCNIEASTKVVNIAVGSTATIDVSSNWGDVVWSIQNTAVAKINSISAKPHTQVTIEGVTSGKTYLVAADMNNCAVTIEINVYNPCTGYYMDPSSATVNFGSTQFLQVTNGIAPYGAGSWLWTKTPDGLTPLADVTLVPGVPPANPASTATAKATACGTVLVEATDRMGICTGTYQSTLTIPSPLTVNWGNVNQQVYVNPVTATVTAGRSGQPLTWSVLPAGAATITPSAGTDSAQIRFNQSGAVTITVNDPGLPGCGKSNTYAVTCKTLQLSVSPGPYFHNVDIDITASGGSGQEMTFSAPGAHISNDPIVGTTDSAEINPPRTPALTITVTDPGYGGAACPNTITVGPIN